MKVPVFSIIDVNDKDYNLYTYIYSEKERKKGGNDVVLLIMKFLKDQGYLDRNKQLVLTIVCNKYTGQNKNNKVLQLAPYLVEAGYFEKVTFAFFVASHTKNDADKRFNNMKLCYANKNLYTMKQLVKMCNTGEYVTAIQVNHTVFFDYGKLFDTIYCPFPPEEILQYQLLTCSKAFEDNVPIWCSKSNLPDANKSYDLNLQKTARNDDSVIVINENCMERSNFVKLLTAEQLYENALGMSE